jgi:Arc/MetJ family transcription regulator
MRRQKSPELRISKRIRTTMNLDRDKVRRVRRALGTKTDTEAVDRALDVVLANAEIESAIDASFGQLSDFKVL